ncbi:hypothetical protein [Cellulosimicrobium composti]|uniref:Uncharacterized protein n=1 Tax=Cellulosimicrobium composti TaxID=2672572 RepID=A0ABX0BE11_9MICO|nr:hypothetical protein [Cellulosimicrobium composti]NDO89560.1 hypothetical protein [Cellulosimicrobium composti]
MADDVRLVEHVRHLAELRTLAPRDAVGQDDVARHLVQRALPLAELHEHVLRRRPRVRRPPAHLAGQERHDLPAVVVDPEEPRRALEARALEMQQVRLDGGAVRPTGAADGAAPADDAVRDVTPEQRDLDVVRVVAVREQIGHTRHPRTCGGP